METSSPHADLSLHGGAVRTVLVGFLRDEVQNAGFTKAIVGLSGGIDSTVTAYLAAEALGNKNVRGIMMP